MKFFLSNYFLMLSPASIGMNEVINSLRDGNCRNGELYFSNEYGYIVWEGDGNPKDKLFSGIAWYPFLSGVQPCGYMGE